MNWESERDNRFTVPIDLGVGKRGRRRPNPTGREQGKKAGDPGEPVIETDEEIITAENYSV